MELVAEGRAASFARPPAHAAELGMAERVLGAGLGQEFAVGVAHALGDHDHAVAVFSTAGFDLREEVLLVEGNFRETG